MRAFRIDRGNPVGAGGQSRVVFRSDGPVTARVAIGRHSAGGPSGHARLEYAREFNMVTTRLSALILVSSVVASQGAACGGEQASAPDTRTAQDVARVESTVSAGPVHESGSGSVAAEIGPGGGTVELSEGPRLTVPAGILGNTQEYVLQTATLTTAFLNEESEQAVGPTFAISPALTPDSGAVEVSIPLSSMPDGFGEPALAYEYGVGNRVGAEDSQHTRWQYENARYEDGRLVAKMDALTGMRLQFVLTNLEVQ